jgi:hypothetical protein
MTNHIVDGELCFGEQRADIVDFIESDKAYAVVLQAINADGAGPWSEILSIRTISKGGQCNN